MVMVISVVNQTRGDVTVVEIGEGDQVEIYVNEGGEGEHPASFIFTLDNSPGDVQGTLMVWNAHESEWQTHFAFESPFPEDDEWTWSTLAEGDCLLDLDVSPDLEQDSD